jgi:cytochrome c oxidase subunit 3
MASHSGSHNDGLIEYPHDEQFGKASPGKIGMWIFLVTDAMSFSGFLIAYGVLRATKDWPNPVEALGGVELSGFMTFLLICSSLSMVLSIDSCKRHDRKGMLRWLLMTILGGASFLALQVYEYSHLFHDRGMSFNKFLHGNNLFASTFYAITGFHGLHVLTGVLYLCLMYKFAHEGRFDKGNYNQLEIAGLFWHFVDLVWILVFTFVYLL